MSINLTNRQRMMMLFIFCGVLPLIANSLINGFMADVLNRKYISVLSITVLIVLAVSYLLAWYRDFLSAGRVQHARAVALSISGGDLSQKINITNAKDEVGKSIMALGSMQEHMHQLMYDLSVATNGLTDLIAQVSLGNENLSQRTQEQASSLEEVASSMEEMTSTVNQNATNAQQANQLAQAAKEQANRGGETIGRLMGAMNDIAISSERITDIISVIDEIAFQTNLLALNAAVEAARAGEQGRGFAVVASEVRNLAGRSATAAQEIKDLIEDSVRKVADGNRLVSESGVVLDEIVLSVNKVSDIVAEIAAASEEQSQGIEQVNKAVFQIDEMTQENASLVEEAAAASASIQSVANRLRKYVSFIKFDEDKVDMDVMTVVPTQEEAVEEEKQQPVIAPQKKPVLLDDGRSSNGDDSEWQEF